MSEHFEIPYGDYSLPLEIPNNVPVKIIGGDSYSNSNSVDIGKELISGGIKEFLDSAEDLLIIVNDHTRFTPSGRILPHIKSLSNLSKRKGKFEILIATGTHRSPHKDELKRILGPTFDEYFPYTRAHNSIDSEAHYLAGTVSSGIDVYLDKAVEKFHNIIVVGSVEPHFFAGFTGGRKGIFPGVAFKDSIIKNHIKAIDRDVQPLELDNPIHRDMDEVIDLLVDKNIFSIQAVHNPDRSIAGLFCGDIRESFYRAVKLAEKIFVKEIDDYYDIVLAIMFPPLDIDLYQIQKAFENTKYAVKPGGTCILVSKCRDGVGPDDWLKISARYNSPAEVLEKAQDVKMFGFHKLYRPARFMDRSKIFVVSDVEPFYIKSVFLTPKTDLQTAFNDAASYLSPPYSALIVYDAGQNVIRVKAK